MNINTGYKNSVFSLLFNNPEAIRELYSAIEGVSLPPDTPIDINTLSGVLYMDCRAHAELAVLEQSI